MAFSSMTFLCVFLPVVFLLYFLIPSTKLKNFFLIVVSLLFYAYGESVYVFLMIACALWNYGIAGFFPRCKPKAKRLLLALALVLDLGMLGIYKYAGMIVETFDQVTGLAVPVPQIALPIGISFFTFQAISYVADVYRGKVKAEKNFAKILLYISFFPQLIAGPIIQYSDIAEEIDHREVTVTKICEGLRRFIVGLSKKVLISNTMGAAADYVFGLEASLVSMPAAWLGAIAYMMQIYFDFSGYSDMAIGLGRIFGFHFLENFRYPYAASSIQDFWRKWHISLTNWFRDYLYIPLGGNRRGTVRTWLNRLFVFFCTGLWHGANWTFVLWGLFHGAFQSLETFFPKLTKKMGLFRHLYVLLVVCTGFVIFRADTIAQAGWMLGAMFTKFEWSTELAAATAVLYNKLFFFMLLVAAVSALPLKEWLHAWAVKKEAEGRSFILWRRLSYAGSIVLLVICMMSLAGGTYNPFIYFRF